MKLDVILIVGLFLIGVLLGLAVAGWAFRSVLRAVGIEDIKYCEVKTVTCEANCDVMEARAVFDGNAVELPKYFDENGQKVEASRG